MSQAQKQTRALMKDILFAFRQIRSHPVASAVIIGTQAVILGVLCLVMAAMERDRQLWMPYPDPDRVTQLWQVTKSGAGNFFPGESYPELVGQIQGWKVMAAVNSGGPGVLTGEGEPRSTLVYHVSPSLFDVMGVQPELGRAFTPEEARSGREELLVISHDLWQSFYAGDPSIIGRSTTLNQRACVIIGVLPKGVHDSAVLQGADVLTPKSYEAVDEFGGLLQVFGRRSDDVSSSRLNAELQAKVTAAVTATVPDFWEEGPVRVGAWRADARPGRRLESHHLFGVAIPVFVVGIAGFNVANVLLARMLARRHEFAVRFSMGAPRGRVVRQLLVESGLLAAIGGAFGALLAYAAAQWARTQGLDTHFNAGVLGGTMAGSLILGLSAGWLPAARATRGVLATDLKDSSRASAGGGVTRHRLRDALVVGQVAMAVALCLGAGLLVRSDLERRGFDPGYDAGRLLRVSVPLNGDRYDDRDARLIFAERVKERLLGLPGIENVSISSDRVVERLPFPKRIAIEGDAGRAGANAAAVSVVGPDHFEMINVPMLQGRPILETDRRGSPSVAVVNQSFADRYFPDDDPVGRRIGIDIETDREWVEIVGVFQDRRDIGITEDHGPEVSLSAKQHAPGWIEWNFLAATASESADIAEAALEATRSIDPDCPVERPKPLSALIRLSMERNRAGAQAIAAIGLFGFILALLGIYGVVAHSVTERTREMGVRMALGATRGDVLRMALSRGMRLTVGGLTLGLILGAMITSGTREMLYGITPYDLPTYLFVCAALALAALAAACAPARRAVAINPQDALRYE